MVEILSIIYAYIYMEMSQQNYHILTKTFKNRQNKYKSEIEKNKNSDEGQRKLSVNMAIWERTDRGVQ
jgi:hypothetical protein